MESTAATTYTVTTMISQDRNKEYLHFLDGHIEIEDLAPGGEQFVSLGLEQARDLFAFLLPLFS